MTTDRRPPECCGVCPPIVGGGFDCTCKDNPRCPGPHNRAVAAGSGVPFPGIDSPGRDRLADAMRRALDEDMKYDDDDWTRLADAALSFFHEGDL